jgi:hypothetical protein
MGRLARRFWTLATSSAVVVALAGSRGCGPFPPPAVRANGGDYTTTATVGPPSGEARLRCRNRFVAPWPAMTWPRPDFR